MASVSYSSPMSSAYVEIKVACAALPGRRVDSFAVLMEKRGANRHGTSQSRCTRTWTEIARTETVQNEKHPAFVESFEVSFPMRTQQLSTNTVYRIAVFHQVSTRKSADLKKQTLLGYTNFTLSELLQAKDGTVQKTLALSRSPESATIPPKPSSILDRQHPRDSAASTSTTSQFPEKRFARNASGNSFSTSLLFSSSKRKSSKRSSVPDICKSLSPDEPSAASLVSDLSRRQSSSDDIDTLVWSTNRSQKSAKSPEQHVREFASSNTTVKWRKRAVVFLSGEMVEPHRPSHMYSVHMGFQPYSGAEGPLTRTNSSSSKRPKLFYVLYRALPNSDTDYTPVYRSELLDVYASRMDQVNFQSANIRSERLHGMNEHRPLRFEFFHHKSDGSDASIGYIQTSASSFRYAKRGGKLFVEPNHVMNLASAFVVFDSAVMDAVTRRGTLSSVFSLYAGGFVWGVSTKDRASAAHLDIDNDGRDAAALRARLAQDVPRGVSYMSFRALQLMTEQGSHEYDQDSDHHRDSFSGIVAEMNDRSSPRSVLEPIKNLPVDSCEANHHQTLAVRHEKAQADEYLSHVPQHTPSHVSEDKVPGKSVKELQRLFAPEEEIPRKQNRLSPKPDIEPSENGVAEYPHRATHNPLPDADDFLACESSFRTVAQVRQTNQAHAPAFRRLGRRTEVS